MAMWIMDQSDGDVPIAVIPKRDLPVAAEIDEFDDEFDANTEWDAEVEKAEKLFRESTYIYMLY